MVTMVNNVGKGREGKRRRIRLMRDSGNGFVPDRIGTKIADGKGEQKRMINYFFYLMFVFLLKKPLLIRRFPWYTSSN